MNRRQTKKAMKKALAAAKQITPQQAFQIIAEDLAKRKDITYFVGLDFKGDARRFRLDSGGEYIFLSTPVRGRC